MSAITNALYSFGSTLGTLGSNILGGVKSGYDTAQRKFVEVTDACLPKSIAPTFRDVVTSAPITYAALNLPAVYPLLTFCVLTIVESAKDMIGEPRAEFPGKGFYKTVNNGLGGAFLVTSSKLAYAFGKTLLKVGTVRDPFIKTAQVVGLSLVASFFYSRKDKGVPTIATLTNNSLNDMTNAASHAPKSTRKDKTAT